MVGKTIRDLVFFSYYLFIYFFIYFFPPTILLSPVICLDRCRFELRPFRPIGVSHSQTVLLVYTAYFTNLSNVH
ncbi:hypothetical protein BDV28DRAFT_134596 [Aspergillus coremiiformis]|uniref:Uncharacterized protein n=1 Tax=Aspergillus coremiiformis TaxID=138285 RepID=A0A5N6Z6F9_9EURO|nr:hypothetical protein BDV28DRAFT_134596 [Aspergillus coremiiformis]